MISTSDTTVAVTVFSFVDRNTGYAFTELFSQLFRLIDINVHEAARVELSLPCACRRET